MCRGCEQHTLGGARCKHAHVHCANSHTHKETHTQAFHGDKELFNSDHEDVVHKNTIIGKCNVHSLKAYEALRNIGDHDFFARFSYKVRQMFCTFFV